MAVQRKKNRKQTLIRGSLCTLIGFSLWKAADVLQVLLIPSDHPVHGILFGLFAFVMSFCAFGFTGLRNAAESFAGRSEFRSLRNFRMGSAYLIMGLGFAAAAVLTLCSDGIALLIFKENTAAVQLLKKGLCLVSPVFLLIPLLYHFRAIGEALGNHKVNAVSQIAGQGFRILLLLIGALVFAKDGNGEKTVAFAAVSMWVWTLAPLGVYVLFDYANDAALKEMVRTGSKQKKKVRMGRGLAPYFLSGFFLALPYALIPMELYFLSRGTDVKMMDVHGYTLYGSVFSGAALAASAWLFRPALEKLEDSLEEQRDGMVVKYAEKAMLAALFVLLPCVIAMRGLEPLMSRALFAKEAIPTNGSMFAAMIQGCMDHMILLLFLILAVLRKRRETVAYLAIGAVVRLAAVYGLFLYRGYPLCVTGEWIGSAAALYLLVVCLSNRYEMRVNYILLHSGMILFASFCMNGLLVLVQHYLPMAAEASGMMAFGMAGVLAAAGAGVYLLVCSELKVTESLFAKR